MIRVSTSSTSTYVDVVVATVVVTKLVATVLVVVLSSAVLVQVRRGTRYLEVQNLWTAASGRRIDASVPPSPLQAGAVGHEAVAAASDVRQLMLRAKVECKCILAWLVIKSRVRYARLRSYLLATMVIYHFCSTWALASLTRLCSAATVGARGFSQPRAIDTSSSVCLADASTIWISLKA